MASSQTGHFGSEQKLLLETGKGWLDHQVGHNQDSDLTNVQVHKGKARAGQPKVTQDRL